MSRELRQTEARLAIATQSWCHDKSGLRPPSDNTGTVRNWLGMSHHSLTSAVLLTQVREPPDVTEAHAEPEDGEEELDGAVPGHPGLARPLLQVHVKC